MDPGLVLRPEGVLDEDLCAVLRRALAQALASGMLFLVIDLRNVNDIEQAGFQFLRGLHVYLRSRGGSVAVVHARESLQTKLRTNELGDLIDRAAKTERQTALPDVINLDERRRAADRSSLAVPGLHQSR